MIFFRTLTIRGPFHRKAFKWRKIWGYRVNFWKKKEVLYAKLNKRVEAATSNYSATTDFLQHIYSALVAKNHLKIQSRCLVHEFSFTYIFININHGYRAAILKKNSLWLLLFYMAVATYCYYEKVHTTMHTAIVSYVLNYMKNSFV